MSDYVTQPFCGRLVLFRTFFNGQKVLTFVTIDKEGNEQSIYDGLVKKFGQPSSFEKVAKGELAIWEGQGEAIVFLAKDISVLYHFNYKNLEKIRDAFQHYRTKVEAGQVSGDGKLVSRVKSLL